MENPIYIGDGVYARFAEGELELWTNRAGGERHWLVLGPAELSNLIAWLQRMPGSELCLNLERKAES